MTADRAYRVLIAFDSEKNDFIARVPELDLEAHAATRAEAVTEIEGALEQRIAGAAEDKQSLPEPADAAAGPAALTLNLSPPLHKDLLFHARASRMRTEELAVQLLAKAIGGLDGGRPRRRPEPEPRREDAGEGEDANRMSRPPRDDRDRDDRDDRGRGRRKREGYRPELEDKANFLEYLRGLEKGGPQGGGRGRR
jgi:predicted RNase H-like HicB family nuclease